MRAVMKAMRPSAGPGVTGLTEAFDCATASGEGDDSSGVVMDSAAQTESNNEPLSARAENLMRDLSIMMLDAGILAHLEPHVSGNVQRSVRHF